MNEKVILFQGDSITDCGRGTGIGNGYANMVIGEVTSKEPYKYTCYNRGISGNRIVDVYARIKTDIINLKPDYMSILIGINDVWHEINYQNGVDAEKFEMVYSMLIEEIKKALPEIKIMILEPFVLPGSATVDCEEAPNRWNTFETECKKRAEASKRIAKKYNLTFIPLQDMFTKANADADEMGYWLRDGVHPTPAGHNLIKAEWLKTFESIK